jgi:ATP-dependent Clp protease ATP-binding subunit ClpC
MREIAGAFGLSHQRVHQIVGDEETPPQPMEFPYGPFPHRPPPGFRRARGMLERFTERARKALATAQEEARQLGHARVGTEHLLLGVAETENELVAGLLVDAGLGPQEARAEVERLVERGEEESAPERLRFTGGAKQVLEVALREALSLGHNYIGVEHLLIALARDERGAGGQILREHGLEPDALREQIERGLAA